MAINYLNRGEYNNLLDRRKLSFRQSKLSSYGSIILIFLYAIITFSMDENEIVTWIISVV